MTQERINEDGEIEQYNEWTHEWEVWHCPDCGAQQTYTNEGEGYVPHSDFCSLQ